MRTKSAKELGEIARAGKILEKRWGKEARAAVRESEAPVRAVREPDPPVFEPDPLPPPEPEPEPIHEVTLDGPLFDDIPEEAIVPLPDDGIPALDSDLTPDEKQEFIKLLNAELPLAERAKLLAVLARFKDQKRAAVGLRAIQEINSITGLSKERPTESAPMFVLPPDAKVSVTVTKVVK
jgi:hypothetical protein